MTDETKTKVKDILERLSSDPSNGITLENGLSKSQLDTFVSDVQSHFGRVIKGYEDTITSLTKENSAYKADYEKVNKGIRESRAKELEAETGVKSSIILKHGGEKLEDMEKFAKETAEEQGIKPAKKDEGGDNHNAEGGDKQGDNEIPTDSGDTIGTNDVNYDDMSGRQLIHYGLEKERSQKK